MKKDPEKETKDQHEFTHTETRWKLMEFINFLRRQPILYLHELCNKFMNNYNTKTLSDLGDVIRDK